MQLGQLVRFYLNSQIFDATKSDAQTDFLKSRERQREREREREEEKRYVERFQMMFTSP